MAEYHLECSGKNAGQVIVLTEEVAIAISELMIASKQIRTETRRLTDVLKVIAENVDNADTN